MKYTTEEHGNAKIAAVAAATRMAYPLAELNDLLTNAPPDEIARLPRPLIDDP
jgi:hypothetical protein